MDTDRSAGPPNVSSGRGVPMDALLVGLLLVAVAALACLMPAQSDTFWSLRAGQEIWRTAHLPRVDGYSYTAAGLPWPDHEWLWQASAYGLFAVGGLPLLTAASAAVVVAAFAVVWRLMVGRAPVRFAILVAAVPLSALVWAPRPQIVTLLLLACLMRLLGRQRFGFVPLLFVVWANLHGGVVLGGVVLGAALVAAVARVFRGERGAADRARVAWLAAVVPASALACAATPLGFGIFPFVLQSEARLREARVNEWLPPLPGLSVDGAVWLLGAAFVVVLLRRRRALAAGGWEDWVACAGAVALLPLAFRSVRHVAPFLLLAPIAVSRLLGADFRLRRAPGTAGPDRPAVNAGLLAVAVAGGILTVAVAWARPAAFLRWRLLPDAALTAIRACPDPLYNHYNQGGELIWFVPERKVFIDNRQDPYPLPFLREHLAVESGTRPWALLFARYGIRCAILPPSSPTVAGLTQAGWGTLYTDGVWTVQRGP